MEAVPACVKVANYRYQELVKIILNLERLGGYQGILYSIDIRRLSKLLLIWRD